ncbi:NAD(P)H dehydrogenase [Prauserella marina]|uniref:Multimeric flavodoxin WrbA n=1 Tax=Prauserella marina TaxID=530584 RepID=A0A222VTJ5_9PSEU|nr:flavodoxin family protein [Prauserella marina]ASR37234.1 NAD(P)H dehydrogenase [Prauserella marina]PWV72559.1 multimeric flavodoxin WrbA [Prauserella marina]SDD77183.1 Multimeric flavodoxin WrbA [Prauserella marina]
MKVLALSSSPRKDGNSRLLAQAVLDGATSMGHKVELIDLADVVKAPLGDCRTCRLADGRCSIDDGYEELLHTVLAADALVLATPLYWYGVSGQLKIFLDRIFCHAGAEYPRHEEVERGILHKRLAVVVTSEESYPGASLGVTAHMQELARYLRHDLVGIVRGTANSRGEITRDPAKPVEQAHNLGTLLFELPVTDYRMDTVRDGVVWQGGAPFIAGKAR